MLLGQLVVLLTALQVSSGSRSSGSSSTRSVLKKLIQSMTKVEDEINHRHSRSSDWDLDFSRQSDAPSSFVGTRNIRKKRLHQTKRVDTMLNPDEAYNSLCYQTRLPPQKVKGSQPLRIIPSSVRRHKLYCKNGYFLAVSKKGQVNGTLNSLNDDLTDLEFLSIGRQLVLIRSTNTKKYITMTSNSRVKAIATPTFEAAFLYESYKQTSFITFKSLYHRKMNWYLALKRSGHVKPGKSTAARQSSAQFLII